MLSFDRLERGKEYIMPAWAVVSLLELQEKLKRTRKINLTAEYQLQGIVDSMTPATTDAPKGAPGEQTCPK